MDKIQLSHTRVIQSSPLTTNNEQALQSQPLDYLSFKILDSPLLLNTEQALQLPSSCHSSYDLSESTTLVKSLAGHLLT